MEPAKIKSAMLELSGKMQESLLATCKSLAKALPEKQEKEMTEWCKKTFGKREFKEVVVSAPTPEPTAQVSPPSPVVLVRGYPEVPAPETAIEQSPALEPLKPPSPPPPTMVMS